MTGLAPHHLAQAAPGTAAAGAPSPPTVVAIDGPAASGKSSVARALARRLGFLYVNTGAMYRAATWLILEHGIDPADAAAAGTLVAGTPFEFRISDGEAHIRADGRDPTPFLASPRVNAAVSTVAKNPAIRALLVARQQEFGRCGNLVMEGRDIGSVVFPDTPHKFFLDASEEVRAGRRAAQGYHDAIGERDRADTSRRHSPLLAAPGAIVIDTSDLTVDGVVAAILAQLAAAGLAAQRPPGP